MEIIYDLSPVRRVHQLDLAEYGQPGKSAYWCEWDHPQVSDDRAFSDLMRGPAKHWRWSELIRPGDTCIDIGAHSGDTTVPMAVCAYGGDGNLGTVIAVEPNTRVLPVLKINLALNAHLARFHTVNKAITREAMAEVEIADHGNHDCNGGIIAEQYSEQLQGRLKKIASSKITVEGARLDHLCEDLLTPLELERLSFIKTDCEGYDKEILRSSVAFLQKQKPYMFIEWFNYFTEEDTDDLFNAIDEINYVAFNPATKERVSRQEKIDDLLLIHRSRA